MGYLFDGAAVFCGMDVNTAICKIKAEIRWAADAVVFDDAIADKIKEEEESVRSVSGMEVINEAFNETYSRDVRLCIFCRRHIEELEESVLALEDHEGNTLGMVLPSSMIPEYEGRTDIIWVSRDFIMFPGIPSTGAERFILKPMRFTHLNERCGCFDAVMSSPAPSSDILIKKHYGVSLAEELSTLIIGFNISGKE